MSVQLPDDPELLNTVDWRGLPLGGLLEVVEALFKELLMTTEEATDADRARATCLRLVLAEVSQRAARILPPPPVLCGCGEMFATADELDEHFWAMFVPKDDVGTDGRMHGEVDRGWLMARAAKGGAETETRAGS